MVAPLWIEPDTSVEEMRDLLPLRDERGGLWRGGVAKFFIDGVIDTGTAWLDEPDTLGDGTEPFWPDPAVYDAAVALFAGSGFQVVTHAIGDRAVRQRARRLPRRGRGDRDPPPRRARRDAEGRGAETVRPQKA